MSTKTLDLVKPSQTLKFQPRTFKMRSSDAKAQNLPSLAFDTKALDLRSLIFDAKALNL